MSDKTMQLTSAFDDNDTTIVIHAPHWSGHEMVTARIVPTVEDEEWVNNQVLVMKSNAQKQGMDFSAQLGATRRLWLERLIVSWTFTSKGQPVLFSSKAVKKLPTHYADYIYDEIMSHQPKMSQEEEDDFLQNAEPTTVEQDEPRRLAAVK